MSRRNPSPPTWDELYGLHPLALPKPEPWEETIPADLWDNSKDVQQLLRVLEINKWAELEVYMQRFPVDNEEIDQRVDMLVKRTGISASIARRVARDAYLRRKVYIVWKHRAAIAAQCRRQLVHLGGIRYQRGYRNGP